MKTTILMFAVLFVAFTGCGNGAQGLYVGHLNKKIERAGYKTVTTYDNQFGVEAAPSRTGKWLIITGLADSPVFFDRQPAANGTISLAAVASDGSYEAEADKATFYTEKIDFTSGTGFHSPSGLSIDLVATVIVEEDGQKITKTITWDFDGWMME